MKEFITESEFLYRQPSAPQKTSTDKYYYRLCNRLADMCLREKLLDDYSEIMLKRVLLGVVDYFQDILTDSGVFRSFSEEHKKLYGRWLPFYDTDPEHYIPHELNPEDIRFLIWYTIAMYSEGDARKLDPMDTGILRATERIHEELNRLYDDPDTPVPEDYNITRGLELNNPEEADEIFHFGNWLFMYNYLMTPAYALTLSEIIHGPRMGGKPDPKILMQVMEESMMEDPTGPLALYLREWIYLILKGCMPPEKYPQHGGEDHPYYKKVIEYTGGSPIAFFPTYSDLNRFFIDVLGWENEDNLPSLKTEKDFVILVNREKGMLVAKNVAACIKMDGNECYDRDYAEEHAIDLLTIRGLCPADLLHYIFEHDALPDAHFPGNEDHAVVHNNRDFIARCYLQKYYRGD